MGPAVCDVTFVVEVLYLKYSLRSYKNDKIRFQTYFETTLNISKIPKKERNAMNHPDQLRQEIHKVPIYWKLTACMESRN